MQNTFSTRFFKNYQISALNESFDDVQRRMGNFSSEKVTTVFLSHKHDDLITLMGLIGFLEKEYKVNTYIDSFDSSMPTKTSGDTARKLKKKINECDKFVFMATDGAIQSKWCNWELGYGDSCKFPNDIAIFRFSDDTKNEGNEYFSLYPYIAYYDGSEKCRDGSFVKPGYYHVRLENEVCIIQPLKDWLS